MTRCSFNIKMQFMYVIILLSKLQSDVVKARSMIQKLERQILTDYNTISQSTVTEIARYREPPYPVHTVLQAALLLLGEDEQTTEVVTKREY